MSLHLAVRYADSLGLKHVILTPDQVDPQYVAVDADKPLTRGAASILRTRVWMAVCDHRRACSEPASVLDHPWEFVKTPTGAWQLRHEECRMTSRGAA